MADTTKIEMELLDYLNRGLVTVHEWATLRMIEIYAREKKFVLNGMIRQKARCTACGEEIEPFGSYRFMTASGSVKFCDPCWKKLCRVKENLHD